MPASGYRDYFKVLGVERNASGDAIKSAFRRLARQFHPDVNPGDSNAEAKFKEINEAYEVLSDPEKRRKYEQFGQYWNQVGRTAGSGSAGTGFDVDFGSYGNFDEFINDLLGKFGGARGAAGFPGGFTGGSGFPKVNNSPSSSNLDAEVTMKIAFGEAFHGTQRTLSVNEERVKVRIPPGMRSGSRLRLKGKGNLQPSTGRRGDLYLNLEVQAHSVWLLDGDQLRADLPVTLDEFIFGGTVTTMTPDGEAQVSIPPGTSPGRNLRLKGKGWPLGGNRRGDLIFTLSMHFPDKWSSEELELLEQMKRIRCNDPRKSWLQSARL